MDTTKRPTELAAVPCSGIREDVFGWFDSLEQTTPAHDPGPTAPCVVCIWPVEKHSIDNPVVTISLALYNKEHRDRSFFFRAHKRCWERQTQHEQSLIESSLIDRIAPITPEEMTTRIVATEDADSDAMRDIISNHCATCHGTRQIQTTEWPAIYDACPDCQNDEMTSPRQTTTNTQKDEH